MDANYYAAQISNDVLSEIFSISFLSDKVARQLIIIAHLKEELAEGRHAYDCMDAELSREIDELKERLIEQELFGDKE